MANLIAHLPFDNSPTEDTQGNTWTAYGNPTIGTNNAFSGKALQLDGQSYLKLTNVNVTLGGQDFSIDGYVYVDPSSPDYACVLNVITPDTGYVLVSVRKSPTDATRLEIWFNSYAGVTQDKGYTHTSSINSVGERVHFRLLYRYSTNRGFYFYINDKLAGCSTGTDVPQFTRRAFNIDIGAWPNGIKGVIGSIDELRIYDGGFPTFAWRYENPGNADALITASTVLADLPATKSKFGVAFYQTTRAKCFDLPPADEIWVKFDVYFDGENRWRAYNDSSAGACGICSYFDHPYADFGMWQNNNRVQDLLGICKTNQLQTVLLHMKVGTSDGIIEAWVDGNFIYRCTGDVNNGAAFEDIYLQSDDAGTFFSNVIISNAEIGLNEDAESITDTINFKPEMFVSVIYDPLQIDVDETYDVKRALKNNVTETFDAERRLVYTEQETYDILRIVTQPVEVAEIFDTERRLANEVQIIADVSREIANGGTIVADVIRNVTNISTSVFDVERRVQTDTPVTFDVERRTVSDTSVIFDVERALLFVTTGERMLSRISPIYDESTFMQTFFRAIGAEWEKIRRYFLTLREQRFIHTVDWGIEYLEHKYSVVPDRTLTLEERRARLGMRSYTKYPLNPAVLEKFARDNFGLEIYLDESEAGYIWMFITNFTKTSFKGYMKHLLREKPAHLALAVLLYMTLYVGRERDDGLPKLYAGVVEVLTGSGTITLPKPKSQRLTIYAGIAQIWRGSITLKSKTNPYPRLPNQRLNIFTGVVQYWRGSVTIGSKTKPYEHSY